MVFDYKKECREFYMPKKKPSIIEVPEMNYVAVRGKGDPNREGGEYKKGIETLYSVAYTIKMSKKGDHRIDGYFDFVVPPLEGFWWQDGVIEMNLQNKDDFRFISVIRLPEFVTEEEFRWAVKEAERKKKRDFSDAEFLTVKEGLCVQAMHLGPFDDEIRTIDMMHEYINENGYVPDMNEKRLHHEIYLSDIRRTAPEKLRTVVRHPIRKK